MQEGITADFYHAGLDNAVKDLRQKRWQNGEIRVMVATNAFGMGIDKPDVRIVLHIDLPDSPEAYFQEAGRAGRDGLKAYAVILYAKSDKMTLHKRVADTFPEKEYILQVYEHLQYYYQMAMGDGFQCIREFNLEEFCRKFKYFPVPVDSALKILTQAGYLEYTDEQDNASRILFTIRRDELYKLREMGTEAETQIQTILRSYTGVLFIRRPILSGVISVVIVFLGLLAITSLPITQFPDIVPPSVTVTARYTGANADVMAKTVATPLERAINGVPGMTYMTTVCTNDGMSLTTIYFKVGTDPDVASVNVQNRVTTVLDELPEEVIRAGVITEKEVNSMLMYLNIMSTDSSHTEKFVYNFADINILRELKRIDGVGFVEIMGSRDYAMRVWLNPNRLAAYNMSPQEVTAAIRSQNIEAAPGKTGISSDKIPQQLQYVLQYSGKFSTPEEYGEIVLKALPDGSVLRLKDVATIEFDSEDYNMISMTDGKPSASIMIKQRPGSNAREVIQNIKAKMEEIKESSFAPGMDYNISYDVSRFLDASISVVLRTLLEAFLLVFIVVYLFLQDFRSTLIPAIAVPVSLVGTFFFMQMLGFSINMLTLFALVLAIGIVVDNAIVVVEAVHVKMHNEKLPPAKATEAAIREIGGAIIAITLVMSAVFVPVGFMSGTVGIFYRQFSLTLAVAIVISGVNALTLSPALCALMLKPVSHDKKVKKSLLARFFDGFNKRYDHLERRYKINLRLFLNRRFLTYASLIIFCLATWGMTFVLPSGFIPNEDQGMIYVNVDAPPGATLERSEAALSKVQAALLPLEEVETVSTLAGYSLMTETEGASFGMGMINLKPWNEREQTAEELMRVYADRVSHIKDADIQFFLPPTVPGFGNASGFELRLQDKTAGTFAELDEVAKSFVAKLNADPRLSGVTSGFNPNFPQYLLRVDLAKAAKLGIDVNESMETLQSYVGSFYSSNFVRFGQMYKVMLQAAPEYRMNPEDLFGLYI